MARKFLTGIDLVQNQLLNGALQNLAAPPSTPVGGQVYLDTTQAAAGNPALLAWNATASAWELKATNALLLQGQNGAYYLARANQTGTWRGRSAPHDCWARRRGTYWKANSRN